MSDVGAQLEAVIAERERRRRAKEREAREGKLGHSMWFGDRGVYVNKETGRIYNPHHDEECEFVYSDSPRYFLCKGGEGSGKSVAGIIKDLERLRRGCSGIMGSPDFEHFKKSLWPEFLRWVPMESVVPQHRYRVKDLWTPNAPFTIGFISPVTGKVVTLMCGGFEDPESWEGPNVNFGHFDEARRHKTPKLLKVLDGRCRIQGPGGIPSQLYFTTTPRKNWLFDYFGPPKQGGEDDGEGEEYTEFKKDSKVITLKLSDNQVNLDAGFVDKRGQSLTAAEQRVLMDAEWEDIDDTTPFLTSDIWWTNCQEELPPLKPDEPMVIALDAATGRKTAASDCFAMVGITRHPDPARAENSVAVRYIGLWQAKAGQKIDFRGTEEYPGPITELIRLCEQFNVVALTYDPVQMVAVAQELEAEAIVWCWEFAQQNERIEADRLLLDLIVGRRFAHSGDHRLTKHIMNADRKLSEETADRRKFRIVKGRGRIDLAVASSMGAKRCLDLAL